MTSLRILEIATAGISGIFCTILGTDSLSKLLADAQLAATSDDWINRIVGPFGALVLCVTALVVIVRFVSARITLSDLQAKETQAMLLSLVRESSANTVRLTDKLVENTEAIERNTDVIDANTKTLATVTATINRCQDKPKP